MRVWSLVCNTAGCESEGGGMDLCLYGWVGREGSGLVL